MKPLIPIPVARAGVLAALCVIFVQTEPACAQEPAQNPGAQEEQKWIPITSDKVAEQLAMTDRLLAVCRNAIKFSYEVHIELLAKDVAHPSIYFQKGKRPDVTSFQWDYDRQATKPIRRAPSLRAEVILRTKADLQKVLRLPQDEPMPGKDAST